MNKPANITKRSPVNLKIRNLITDIIAYLFIFLFLYTASSKLIDLPAFTNILSRSVLVGGLAVYVAYSIPLVEIIVSAMLVIPRTRRLGLYLSLGLIAIFTTYLLYMTIFAETKTCHCGGVISSMSWEQHIVFNIALIALAITGINKRVNHQFFNNLNFFQL